MSDEGTSENKGRTYCEVASPGGMLMAQSEKKAQDINEEGRNSTGEDKKKRTRRPAVEIPRNFTCSVDKCQKQYGSEGSLLQHIKLKHPEVYAQNQAAELREKEEPKDQE